MRFFDTRRFIDGNRTPLKELYDSRMSLSDRALLELRTWHLPPLFDVPQRERATVRAVEEKTLFYSPITEAQTICTACDKQKPTYGRLKLCLPCWDLEIRKRWIKGSGTALAAKIIADLELPCERIYLINGLADLQHAVHQTLHYLPTPPPIAHTVTWSSPKKNFMAIEVGCRRCGYKLELSEDDWLYSVDTTKWGEGTCPNPDCEESFPAHYTWGMHPAEYQAWQESYTNTMLLHRTAARYGTISLLLVNTDYAWVKLLSKIMPITSVNLRVGVIGPQLGTLHRRPGTLEDFYRTGSYKNYHIPL